MTAIKRCDEFRTEVGLKVDGQLATAATDVCSVMDTFTSAIAAVEVRASVYRYMS